MGYNLGMKVKVGVAQYEAPEVVQESIKKLEEMAKKAKQAGAELVVMPETAIGMLGDVKEAATDYLPELQRIARTCEIAVATSFYIKDNGKYFNQGYLVSPEGEVWNKHRKIYLAPPEREQDGISEGREVKVAKAKMGKIGMLICKDGFNKYSHFLYEKLNKLGAEIVCVPTWSLGTWEINTQEYVKALYVYGAFMSRTFVLLSGNLNKSTKSFGRSLIISPIDGVIKEGSVDKEEILVAEIDLEQVKHARAFDAWWQPKERVILC
jgi:predicted amidohydrolase